MEMGCLFFSNTAAVNWKEAKMVCKKYSKSTLVDIQSEMQMGFLQMELDVIANSEGTPNRWWTAGTDMWREERSQHLLLLKTLYGFLVSLATQII